MGKRVFAILSATNEVIQFLGFGEYVGDEIPGPDSAGLAQRAYAFKLENPKIVLDSGEVVWGGECWWGPIERWDEINNGRRVEQVSINDLRQDHDPRHRSSSPDLG